MGGWMCSIWDPSQCGMCFWFSCQLDLSTLAKEQTHHLKLSLEENRGDLVLLVTLTATAAVSITDLSITPLDDPCERREIHQRYVSCVPHVIHTKADLQV